MQAFQSYLKIRECLILNQPLPEAKVDVERGYRQARLLLETERGSHRVMQLVSVVALAAMAWLAMPTISAAMNKGVRPVWQEAVRTCGGSVVKTLGVSTFLGIVALFFGGMLIGSFFVYLPRRSSFKAAEQAHAAHLLLMAENPANGCTVRWVVHCLFLSGRYAQSVDRVSLPLRPWALHESQVLLQTWLRDYPDRLAARQDNPELRAHQDRLSQAAALLMEAGLQFFGEDVDERWLSPEQRYRLGSWMEREYLRLLECARRSDTQPLTLNPLPREVWGGGGGEG
jgi:hypothetical protein